MEGTDEDGSFADAPLERAVPAEQREDIIAALGTLGVQRCLLVVCQPLDSPHWSLSLLVTLVPPCATQQPITSLRVQLGARSRV